VPGELDLVALGHVQRLADFSRQGELAAAADPGGGGGGLSAPTGSILETF